MPEETPDVATVTPAVPSAAPDGPVADGVSAALQTPEGSHSLALMGPDGAAAVAVLNPDGTQVLRFDLAEPDAPPQVIDTPELRELSGTDDGGLLGAGPGVAVRISSDGEVTQSDIDVEAPSVLAQTPDGLILVGTETGRILVLNDQLAPERTFGGFVRVDDITVAPASEGRDDVQVVVLDRAQSSVSPIDLTDGDIGPALRAGNGATNAVVDRYGRVIVANTRDGELVAFYGSPLVMRMRYPVPDGPFAVDYDRTRNLVWVSKTASNEVVGYELVDGEPQERARHDTVGQPDEIRVGADGAVYVLSARDGGIQVIAPDGQG